MILEAEAELNNYRKKHGDCGKVQEALENTLLDMKKAYDIRKAEIQQHLEDKNVVKFYEMDEWNSFAAFNILRDKVWELVAEVVIAYENSNEKDLDKALRVAATEKRIKIGKLMTLLAK